jgi:GAF domain-containing protein
MPSKEGVHGGPQSAYGSRMLLRKSSRHRPPERDEASRQCALDALHLQEGVIDLKLDAIVEFARRAFQADIALVSIIDRDRQWNISRSGTDVFEIPRADSFCGHTIVTDGAFVVPDAAHDSRFVHNPAVTSSPQVRFYAGYPVETASGERIGAMCVLGHEPRSRNDVDIVMLRELALMVQQELPRLASRVASR